MSSTRKRAETVSDMSELEERAIWDEWETVFIPPSAHSDRLLHLYQDCPRLSKTAPREKDIAVYPRGYKDVCKTCLYRYRNEDDG